MTNSLYVDELVSSPEGKTLEFKRDLSSPKPLLKTLVAFANTAGCRLVIGMDDARQIIGVSNPPNGEEPWYCLIANRFERSWCPMLTPIIGFILLGLILRFIKNE